jgi:hypothetical protein
LIKQLSVLLLLVFCANGFAQRPTYCFPDNFDKTYYDYGDITPGTDCLKNQVILKVKPIGRDLCSSNDINIREVKQIFNYAKVTEIKQLYPHHDVPAVQFDQFGRKLSDLTLVYNITYAGNLDIRKFITELNSLDIVEYAQPRMIVQPMLTPNDDSLGLQWYLNKIRAMDAWDLDTGDTNVIIGIVDGGTNFGHQDLSDNVFYSNTDPIDLIDNDNDGFIDNYTGWDIGDNDNNPQYIGLHNSAHGTAMCGIAASGTNDNQGVAGAAYTCRYMPVKMVSTAFGWVAGYEGLVYAADHGAQVINASWGNTTPGPYEQDVVNYVSVNQNSQIFAAAGNSNNTVPFYPASYEEVIAIGGTLSTDVKSGNSSFYEQVDLVAPGQVLFEPYATGYTNGNGTSDASALTCGAAGLIQSYYNGFLPIQIGAIMRQSAFRIDTIPGNAPYLNKQGSGRLDMYRALTNPWKPYLYFNNRIFTDHNDDVIMIGDTVELDGNMLNILDTSSASLIAIITDNSPYVNWLDSNINIGSVNTMEFVNITSQPFQFVILPGCPLNQNVLMKVVYYDGVDTLNTQYFSFVVNRDYYHVDINQLQTSVTTTGRIGFSDSRTLRGLGYRMAVFENNLLGIYWNPMGLFVSKGSAAVSDQTLSAPPIGPCCNFPNDADFVATQSMVINHASMVADLEVTSQYNDGGAGVNAVGLDIKQKLFGWQDSINDQFLIVEYQFQNNTGMALGDWYAGLFSDFDLPDSLIWNTGANRAFYDTSSQTAISQHVLPRFFVGVKILSNSSQVKYYANNSDGSGGLQNVYNGFSAAEKFNFMNPTIPSNISGITDVSQYLGVQFDSMAFDGCAILHMALLIGTSLDDIRDQAILAQAKYNGTFNVWTGNGGNNNWHNAGNWSQGSVPDFTDHVIIPDTRSGSGFSPLISTADGTVKNMEVRCGGHLEINPPYKLRVGN